ncbi:MAG: hypothetical protein K8R21_12855 [Leptospira sp.]|nr:hypothetical protein [Leptospira sp.]
MKTNPNRDSKISKTFFGNDKNANILKGNFKNIKDGTAELVLNWNGIQRIVPVKFRIKNKTELEVEISIDVASWKMNDKLTALNTLCSELHKGKDGKSQLWPTVDVIISSKFEEKCK